MDLTQDQGKFTFNDLFLKTFVTIFFSCHIPEIIYMFQHVQSVAKKGNS